MKNELPKHPGREPVFNEKKPFSTIKEVIRFREQDLDNFGEIISIPYGATSYSIETEERYEGYFDKTIVFYKNVASQNPNYEQELKDYQQKEEEFKRIHKQWTIENAKWNIYMNQKRIGNFKKQIEKLENSVLEDQKKLIDNTKI